MNVPRSTTSESGVTFTLGLIAVVGAIALVAGAVYAAGLGAGGQTTGIVLLALSAGCGFICWRLNVYRKALRSRNSAMKRDGLSSDTARSE
jgi:hypothetical protein